MFFLPLPRSPAPQLSQSPVPSLPATRGIVMASIPMEYGLLLAATLFALGLIGVLVRRNIVFILMSLEIMLNAAGLGFVAAGGRWGQAERQGVVFFFSYNAAGGGGDV